MKLTFVGAAHEVTGSCHFLQAAGKNILIDCGMEQGPDLYENPGLPIPENEIDYVFLTHAHIDHSGMLPKLAKNGFKGQIFTTFATADLCNIMLRDSAHIQEFEAEWRNRKGRRAGKPEFEPVYVMQDALDAIELLVPCGYGERITICDGIQIRFTDVGHLLGSASIEVWATEGDVTKKIVFSGDIGNVDQPIIKDPSYTDSADYIVVESTYGNRIIWESLPALSRRHLTEEVMLSFLPLQSEGHRRCFILSVRSKKSICFRNTKILTCTWIVRWRSKRRKYLQ